ncbi:unnamed protein product [Owenia fusiformis]|uniref:CWF19-like protein 1 n=1 Tax=Owenia fusiformis TaxID=6347 RepID=A0A8J1U1W4_OWEFU|nr:unnamed protein product [Owenia fusiformis]
MSNTTLRVLVAGDVQGKFGTLYKRVDSIQKKTGAFDLLLCVGDFFGDDDSEWAHYVMGSKKVPIPTFILGPNKESHKRFFTEDDGGELCENVTLLGSQGVYTGSSGLKIAYISGMEGEAADPTHFDSSTGESLRGPLVDAKFRGVDILLSSQWPADVEKYATSPEGVESTKTGSRIISQLALSLRPRYHFAALEGSFYERQPYRNHRVLAEREKHVSRFIGLASVGNPQKKKWLYAFNITPMSQMDTAKLTEQPQDVTECPFKLDSSLIKSDKTRKEEDGSQFFYDMKAGENMDKGKKRQNFSKDGGPDQKAPRKQPQPMGPCWFCLSSPEVEKHLVVSVGTMTYLALAKGGLVPDHVLILPIGHYQSTVTLPDDAIEEIDKYKAALKKYFKSQGKGVVFFERNFKTSHLQIQVIPIDGSTARDVPEVFSELAEGQNIELAEIPKHSDLKQIVPAGAPYFYAELPSGEKLLHRIKKFFPLQFGREALADEKILNMEDRVNWKNCKSTKEEETQWAAKFRDTFQSYDFNL